MSKQGNDFWIQYQKDYAHIDMGAMLEAYADARVVQECKVLDETVTLLHQTIANRNVEIAELKAESKYWNERWEAGNKFQDAAFNSEIENYHEVKRLKAENKTLDNRCSRLANIANQHRSSATAHFIHNLALKGDVIPKLNAEIKRLRDILDDPNLSDHDARWSAFGIADALSPAPVTEGPTVQDNYCPLCIGTGKEIGVYEIGICSCRNTSSPLNEDQE